MKKKATPNEFQIIFNSNLTLGKTINNIRLNLASNEIIFVAQETHDYQWMNWLVSVPADEVVTLFFMNEGNPDCVLLMEGLYVFDHFCILKDETDLLGINPPNVLEHQITIQFKEIERVNHHILTKKDFEARLLQNSSDL